MLPDEIYSYGGDARVIATRVEIDRVVAELTGLESWLLAQVEPQDFVVDPVRRARLALELPPIIERINHIRLACLAAADGYFGGEVEISRELRERWHIPIADIAAGVVGIGATLGWLRETKVNAKLVSLTNSVLAPTSITSLASRLSETAGLGGNSKFKETGGQDDGTAWVRIEKYRAPVSSAVSATKTGVPEAARFVVYIPGTQSWGLKPGQNPLDLMSNLNAISKTGSAGSERAVALAMKQAGVKPSDKVLFVGHSQGGLVAGNLATRFTESKVLTFGAPLGQLTEALTLPAVKQGRPEILAVEHTGDLVPKLDARPNPLVSNWVTVRHDFATKGLVEQHDLEGYIATSIKIDQDAALPIRDEIAKFTGKEPGQSLYFELRRGP